MDNRQPLDEMMDRLKLSNADLVNASTEQLTFKMVRKGRVGNRLTPNIQDKILNALLAAKPGLQARRRDLFRYEMSADAVQLIEDARVLVASGKVKYPGFVDLLGEAGVSRYGVDVATGQTTFYGPGGEAYVVEGSPAGSAAAGLYSESHVKAAIASAQKGQINYQTFLQKIYDAGIVSYEVNVRERKIAYKGEKDVYREAIPVTGAAPETKVAPAMPKKTAKKASKKKPISKRNSGMTRKARLGFRERARAKLRSTRPPRKRVPKRKGR